MCRLFTVTSISHKKKGRKKERKKEKTETKKEKSTQHEKKEKKRPTSATQPPFISNQVLKTLTHVYNACAEQVIHNETITAHLTYLLLVKEYSCPERNPHAAPVDPEGIHKGPATGTSWLLHPWIKLNSGAKSTQKKKGEGGGLYRKDEFSTLAPFNPKYL